MKKLILLSLLLSVEVVGISQPYPCNVNDSLALVEFYFSANGPTWTDNTNWLTGPVNSWYGIMLAPDTVLGFPYRVSTIGLINNNLTGSLSPLICQLSQLSNLILMNNNLTGSIPDCILHLYHLNTFALDNNDMTGQFPSFSDCPLHDIRIPNNEFTGEISDSLVNYHFLAQFIINNNFFSSIPPQDTILVTNTNFNLSDNRFTFKDVVFYAAHYSDCVYAPQDSVLSSMDTTVLPGTSLILDSWVDTCSDNMYRWKKNGVYLTPNQQSSSQWVLDSVLLTDSGFYTCDIRNIHAPDLVLHRRMIHVSVSNTSSLPEYHPMEREISIRFMPKDQMLQVSLDFNTETPVVSGLYDVSGRKALRLYEGTTRQQDFRFNLDFLKAGVYLVKIQTDTKLLTRKIVLK